MRHGLCQSSVLSASRCVPPIRVSPCDFVKVWLCLRLLRCWILPLGGLLSRKSVPACGCCCGGCCCAGCGGGCLTCGGCFGGAAWEELLAGCCGGGRLSCGVLGCPLVSATCGCVLSTPAVAPPARCGSPGLVASPTARPLPAGGGLYLPFGGKYRGPSTGRIIQTLSISSIKHAVPTSVSMLPPSCLLGWGTVSTVTR